MEFMLPTKKLYAVNYQTERRRVYYLFLLVLRGYGKSEKLAFDMKETLWNL